jgi:hypothetical protein
MGIRNGVIKIVSRKKSKKDRKIRGKINKNWKRNVKWKEINKRKYIIKGEVKKNSNRTTQLQIRITYGNDKEIWVLKGASIIRNGCKIIIYERNDHE